MREEWKKSIQPPGVENFDFMAATHAFLTDPAVDEADRSAHELEDRLERAKLKVLTEMMYALGEAFPEAAKLGVSDAERREVEWAVSEFTRRWAEARVPGFGMTHDQIVQFAEAEGMDLTDAERFAYFITPKYHTRSPYFGRALLGHVLAEYRRVTGLGQAEKKEVS